MRYAVRNGSVLVEWAIRRKEVRKASSLISGEDAPLGRSRRGHLSSVKELPLKGGVRRDVDRQDARLGGGVARRFTRSEHRPTGKSTPIPPTRRSDLLSGHTGWPVAPQGTGMATRVARTCGAGHTKRRMCRCQGRTWVTPRMVGIPQRADWVNQYSPPKPHRGVNKHERWRPV